MLECARLACKLAMSPTSRHLVQNNNNTEGVLDGLELKGMLAVGSMATVYNATLHGQRIVCKACNPLLYVRQARSRHLTRESNLVSSTHRRIHCVIWYYTSCTMRRLVRNSRTESLAEPHASPSCV